MRPLEQIHWFATLALGVSALAACNSSELERCNAELSSCAQRADEFQELLSAKDEALGEEISARDLAEKRMAVYRDIGERIRRVQWSFDPGELSVDVQGGRLVVQLPNRVLFASGETRVQPAGATALREIATILKTLGERQFYIAGHTDNVPIAKKTRRFASNRELSVMRAIAVVRLLEKEGVEPRQLGAIGFGEHHPVAKNNTEAGRAKNRRTEVMIMPTADEIVPLPDEIGGEPGGPRTP